MAFLEVIGELFGFSDRKGWSLVGQDAGIDQLEFKGQFIAENMSENIGSSLGETTTVGKGRPNQQWLHGDSETFTFNSRLFASNSFKNIKQQVETLKSFSRRNKDLKRAPIFLFTAGTEIGFTCFVKGVQIQYDELKVDGSLQGIIASITLQKLEDIITGDASTSLASQIKFAAGIVVGAAGIASQLGRVINIPGFSLHTIDRIVTVVDGDTFESIASAEYGDALLGDILRRVQPEKVNLISGNTVQLIEPTEISEIAVTQQSVALRNTLENLTLREEFFDLRNRKTTIFV